MRVTEIEFEDLPPLEIRCECDDNRRTLAKDEKGSYLLNEEGRPYFVQCTKCTNGYRLSDFGRAVLDLVRRHCKL